MGLSARRIAVLVPVFVAAAAPPALAQDPRSVEVDCSRGGSIARWVDGRDTRALVVVIRGTCNETVSILRDNVTLRGRAGTNPTIHGPDASKDAVTINANRVTIEDLTVTGGRNGIVAAGAANVVVRDTTVQSTGRNGIVVVAGSSATIDGCTLQGNARDGIGVETSQATIINSTVSSNTRFGIFVGVNAGARIGLNRISDAAGNTINANGSNGIHVGSSSNAQIANNTINANGTNLGNADRYGIGIAHASAEILGSNSVTNNTGTGVYADRGSTVSIGNTSFAFSSVNTISGNGDDASPGGVFGFLGTTMRIRDAVISGNKGFGLILSLRSQAGLINSQIQNTVVAGAHPGEGIRLTFGSALFAATPNSSVTGNAGAGLMCTDAESSAVNTGFLGSASNGAVDSCTGF